MGENTEMTTFDRVKELAKKRGLSLLQLNDKAKLGKNAIYKWRTSTPGIDSLEKVADVLGVSVSYLLGNTSDMTATTKDTPTYQDLEDALDGAVAYGGKPMSDNDRRILKGLLQAYFDNKKE